jgi:hypothetical protein
MAYNLFPFLFIVAASTILARFNPELTWNISVISIAGDPNLYEVSQTDSTSLYGEPYPTATEKSTGYACWFDEVNTSYIQNNLLDQRILLRQNFHNASVFLRITAWAVFFDFIILAAGLLISKRIIAIEVFLLIGLLFLIAVAVLMLLGPITSGPNMPFVCDVKSISVQFELVRVSNANPNDLLSVAIATGIAWIFIFARFAFYRDMIFMPKQVQSSNN